MAAKIFLDANVLLDFLLKRKQYEQSKKLIQIVENGAIRAYVTPAIIHIISYWLGKQYSKSTAKQVLVELLSQIRVIDCNHDIVVTAILSDMSDVEDALQYFTAIHHQMDFFVTLDKNLIKAANPILPILSIDGFLSVYGITDR